MMKTSRLDFPYLPAHKHKVRHLEIMSQADIEAALITIAEIPLYYDGQSARDRSANIEASLFDIRTQTNKDISALRYRFSDLWHLWRSLLPVCAVTQLSPETVLSFSRSANIARPRHVWLWLAVVVGQVKLSNVAEYTGRKHSTIYHSRSVVDRQLEAGHGDLVDILTDVLEFEIARSS
jgi:hypothetical protein